MSFYDDASIVLIPSGYKTSKLYSAKPTDGSGDLTFTRTGSTATRVNSEGLIEKCRTNKVTYSNDFSNAAWSKVNSPILTSGQPDHLGGNNAWKFESSSAATIEIANTFVSLITGSFYAKAGNVSVFSIWVGLGVTFDLSNGTITSGAANGKIESVGNGWYRCSATKNNVGLVLNPYFTATAANQFVYIAFAQAEDNDIATAYIPTTSAAVTVGPVANLPRLDYTGGGCPKLLMEPTRTNYALYSESFNNAAWAANRVTVTANDLISVDGYKNAELITANTDNNTHFITPTNLLDLGGVANTISVFAKYNGYHISLSIAGSNLNWTGCVFDLQNGIARTPQSGGSQSVCTAKIENYGNGWYRCSITATPYTTGTFYTDISLTSTGTATLSSFGRQSFTGNGTSGAYIYGMQVERGSYATSYIPTWNASVTRNADSGTTSISSLVNASQGTLFLDYQPLYVAGDFPVDFQLQYNGDASVNGVTIYHNAAKPAVTVRSNSSIIFNQLGTDVNVNSRTKVAIAYKNNDFAFYQNGVLIASLTSGNSPLALNQIRISDGTRFFSINQSLIFKTRLSNTDLATLTTL